MLDAKALARQLDDAPNDDRLSLLPPHRQTTEEILRSRAPGVEVWAYASRVNSRSHPGSDLDLVLRGPGLAPPPLEVLEALSEAFHDSTIPFFVEARDWTRLPASFHAEIERHYVVLIGGGVTGERSGSPKREAAMLPQLASRIRSSRVLRMFSKLSWEIT